MRRTHPLAGALADDAVAVLIEGLGQAAVIIDAFWVLVLARRLEGLRARKAPVVRDRIPATRDQIQLPPPRVSRTQGEGEIALGPDAAGGHDSNAAVEVADEQGCR